MHVKKLGLVGLEKVEKVVDHIRQGYFIFFLNEIIEFSLSYS